MELCSIASGSSGNCIYAGTESSHLMIDAGISGKRIEAGLNSIGLKTAEMQALLVTHEHSNPVAYIMKQSDKKMAVITDLGKYDNYLIDKLQDLDVLLLEANHDVRMLQVGSYPYPLKQRILGDRGHLSNESSGQFLGQLLHDKFKKVVLGHLSKENNLAELAYETVRQGENPYHGNDFPIQVAKRDEVSELIRI